MVDGTGMLLESTETIKPNVAVLALTMRGINDVNTIRQLRNRNPNQIISNTGFESPCSTNGASCRFSPLETPSALCQPQEAGFTLNLMVIVLSVDDKQKLVNEALATGVSGFVLKKTAAWDLIPAIRYALQGRTYASLTAPQGK